MGGWDSAGCKICWNDNFDLQFSGVCRKGWFGVECCGCKSGFRRINHFPTCTCAKTLIDKAVCAAPRLWNPVHRMKAQFNIGRQQMSIKKIIEKFVDGIDQLRKIPGFDQLMNLFEEALKPIKWVINKALSPLRNLIARASLPSIGYRDMHQLYDNLNQIARLDSTFSRFSTDLGTKAVKLLDRAIKPIPMLDCSEPIDPFGEELRDEVAAGEGECNLFAFKETCPAGCSWSGGKCRERHLSRECQEFHAKETCPAGCHWCRDACRHDCEEKNPEECDTYRTAGECPRNRCTWTGEECEDRDCNEFATKETCPEDCAWTGGKCEETPEPAEKECHEFASKEQCPARCAWSGDECEEREEEEE